MILPLLLRAQTENTVESCGYYGDNAKFSKQEICDYYGFTSNSEAEEVVDEIMKQLGLQTNFIVMECPNLRNAFAVNLDGDIGKIRYIIYDNDFLERVDLKSKTDWAAISILAHEIGHHLNGHTLDGIGSRPPKELESDEFSGFALYKLGASLEEAQAAMANFASEKTSKTHPGKADRLAAIESGWRSAESLVPKYRELSRNADYTSIAKKFFVMAYQIEGNDREDNILRAAYYGKATEYRPDYVAAYRNRARYLNILGEYREAIRDAKRAIALDAAQWNAYAERAKAHFGLEEYPEAIQFFTKAINGREAPSPFDFAGRGWVYHKMGKKEDAIADLEKALQLEPGWAYAKQRLKEVSK